MVNKTDKIPAFVEFIVGSIKYMTQLQTVISTIKKNRG